MKKFNVSNDRNFKCHGNMEENKAMDLHTIPLKSKKQ